jgi:CDGSH-type Zn-finger protein
MPDLANADDLARVIERCPSGALQYRRLDGGLEEQTPEPARITPIRNGPLVVRGLVEVKREDGSLEVLPRASLCRCGLSQNKPFCDNSHLRSSFRAPGEVIRIELSPVREQAEFPMATVDDPRD